jgi:hypothetical protein
MKSFKSLLTALLVVSAVSMVQAQTVFDFANLTYNNASNSGFLPTNGFNCSAGDKCSSNISSALSGTLSFASGGIGVNASASYKGSDFGTKAAVVQDHENGYNGVQSGSNAVGAGLGVYHLKNDTSDDNITAKESIKMSFDRIVTLSAIGLRSDGHNTTNWNSNSTFEYSLDNVTWASAALPKNVGQFAMNQTGTDFYFRYGGDHASQFYLSSMTVAAVPEPQTYALMLGGMCVLGWATRRRQSAKV